MRSPTNPFLFTLPVPTAARIPVCPISRNLAYEIYDAAYVLLSTGVCYLLGERKTFWIIRFAVPPGLLHTAVWLPLSCPPAFFQAARLCAIYSRVNFLLRRRGQKPTSFANRGGIPTAGQLEAIRTYWRIGASNSYSASLFANTPPHFQAISF
jgi:hypothetical protein